MGATVKRKHRTALAPFSGLDFCPSPFGLQVSPSAFRSFALSSEALGGLGFAAVDPERRAHAADHAPGQGRGYEARREIPQPENRALGLGNLGQGEGEGLLKTCGRVKGGTQLHAGTSWVKPTHGAVDTRGWKLNLTWT